MYFHQKRNSSGKCKYEAFVFHDFSMTSPHFHRNYEVIYVFSGSMELTVDGRKTILEAGDFALCLANEVHSYETIGPSQCWFANFDPSYVPEFNNAVQGKAAADNRFRCDSSLLPYLTENLLFHGTPDPYRLSAALYMICGEYLHSVTLIERDHSEYALMNDIVDYIAENYHNKLILKDVAHALGYDYFYFSKLFNQTFGVSFSEYLSTFRFNKALKTLRSTDLPISTIALDSGFQSVRSFNDIFLKKVGIPPAQYRKQIHAQKK